MAEYLDKNGLTYFWGKLKTHINNLLSDKQDTLVSGTNVKTINNASILGSGNIAVQPTLESGTNIKTINSTSVLGSGDIVVQPTLVSGTNIKTVNDTSLLGSGDVSVQPVLVSGTNIKTINSNSLLGSGDITIASYTTAVLTLDAAEWVENAQTVTAASVNANSTVIITPSGASMADYMAAKIYCSTQGAGTLTFTCETVPENDVTVNVTVLAGES